MLEDFVNEDGKITPVGQEQLLLGNGTFNYHHLLQLVSGSANTIYDKVSEVFGTNVIIAEPQNNEVSLAEFEQHYEFGRFVDVRNWITEIYKLTEGKLITREKLFEYITTTDGSVFDKRNIKPKRRHCVFQS